jgi:hypothetical protein
MAQNEKENLLPLRGVGNPNPHLVNINGIKMI